MQVMAATVAIVNRLVGAVGGLRAAARPLGALRRGCAVDGCARSQRPHARSPSFQSSVRNARVDRAACPRLLHRSLIFMPKKPEALAALTVWLQEASAGLQGLRLHVSDPTRKQAAVSGTALGGLASGRSGCSPGPCPSRRHCTAHAVRLPAPGSLPGPSATCRASAPSARPRCRPTRTRPSAWVRARLREAARRSRCGRGRLQTDLLHG